VTSSDIGLQYDELAAWWHKRHIASDYGVAQVKRALTFASDSGTALDVGCGSGGRMVRLLEQANFHVTGIDASAKMIELAQTNHPNATFIHEDVTCWDSALKFDFILAWDSLFHLPLNMQKPTLSKLCGMLSEGGVMIHFGDAIGEHTDTWREQEFHYSSIGIAQNIEILHQNGLSLRHLEIDQFPEKHVYAISQRA